MDKLELRQGLQDIYTIMEVFRKAKKDDGQTFIDEINKMDKRLFNRQIDYYNQQGDIRKVRKVRVDLLKKLVDGKNISLNDLAFSQKEEKKKYEKDSFKSWNNFSILHSIYYFDKKEEVNTFLKKLNNNLIKDLGLSPNTKLNIGDFAGAQQSGLEGFRTAIYNNSHEKQQTALQLNLTSFKGKKENLGTNKIGIGLGSGPKYKGLKSFTSSHKTFDITQITYEDILAEFKQYENKILEDIFSTKDGIESNDYPGVRYRVYAPGENARKWEEFYNQGIIGLGWDELGDLNQYQTKKDIADKLKELSGKAGTKRNDATANYEFKNVMKVGDIIIPKKGQRTYLGYGIVKSDYIYDDTFDEYKSIRKIEWVKKGEWKEESGKNIVLKTLTDISNSPEDIQRISKIIGINSENNLQIPNTQNTSLHSLNTILYGAPGTGKTYNMVNYALSIIENKPLIELENEERINLKTRFNQYIEQGQIVFSTFHQSLSYEEFVEGIRANTENGTISYEIEDGIFKKISEKALNNQIGSINTEINIDNLLAQFIDDVSNNLESGKSIKLIKGATIGNINYDTNGYFRSFSVGGTVNDQRLSIDMIKRDYINYKNGQINNHRDIRPRNKSLSQYHGNARYYFALYQKLYEFEQSRSFIKKDKEPLKNYVLIIDEINRGNISKIFGELITLLEPSKRIGAEEELKIKLPYSQEDFGVPQNLYVLGTMNTADRSIALIDIALRRRFAFKEIEPDSELLNFSVGNIDIKRMFKTINERIEFLYNREHRLGHSFFMPLKKDPTLNLLNELFHNHIIPLLQEYFYEDREKIQIVLGDHPRQENKTNGNKFIKETLEEGINIIGFNHEDLENKTKYIINTNPTEKSYIGIYSNTIDDTEEQNNFY